MMDERENDVLAKALVAQLAPQLARVAAGEFERDGRGVVVLSFQWAALAYLFDQTFGCAYVPLAALRTDCMGFYYASNYDPAKEFVVVMLEDLYDGCALREHTFWLEAI
jgi:hypothetical protein